MTHDFNGRLWTSLGGRMAYVKNKVLRRGGDAGM